MVRGFERAFGLHERQFSFVLSILRRNGTTHFPKLLIRVAKKGGKKIRRKNRKNKNKLPQKFGNPERNMFVYSLVIIMNERFCH